MYRKWATFRFYEELNDFLPGDKRKRDFQHFFKGRSTVKTVIEAIGVPHGEIDLILVNGESVGFDYILQSDDRVSVYPAFETLDISPVLQLRSKPLRKSRFILDVHLGKLVKRLRLLGFDSHYRNDYEDEEIVRIAKAEKRIILTRDIELLKRGDVTHGYWLRCTDPEGQAREVIEAFDLIAQFRPFSRCLKCNGELQRTDKSLHREELPPKTYLSYDSFYQCICCRQLFWPGSHHRKMLEWLSSLSARH